MRILRPTSSRAYHDSPSISFADAQPRSHRPSSPHHRSSNLHSFSTSAPSLSPSPSPSSTSSRHRRGASLGVPGTGFTPHASRSPSPNSSRPGSSRSVVTASPVPSISPSVSRSSSRRSSRSYRPMSMASTPPAGWVYTSTGWALYVPPAPPLALLPKSSLSLVTWNIDFMTPCMSLRMKKALSHLALLPSRPDIILFQEICDYNLPDILAHSWVREHYIISNTKPPGRAGYFTITLVERELARSVVGFRRVKLESDMGRDVLFTDIAVEGRAGGEEVVRIGNTHLESLPEGMRRRKEQLRTTATHLREPGIHGGVVAGDMNHILPADEGILKDSGLVDAFLAAPPRKKREGGKKGEKEGHTWGYQPKSRFPAGRLDRIAFCGGVDVEMEGRVGVGLQFKEEEIDDREWEEWSMTRPLTCWVSDHFGLRATVFVGR